MAKSKDPNWIEHAIRRPGALREKLHVPEGKDISEKKLAAAENSKNATERKEAHLAEELEHFRHK
ncbi:MAG: hypothetical protein ACLQVF_27545 [Isosphaeraceae bacterium]